MSKLGLFGGPKIRNKPFPRHPVIGEDEKNQILQVIKSGNISTFVASKGKNFLGGEKIREFERKKLHLKSMGIDVENKKDSEIENLYRLYESTVLYLGC